MGSRLPRKYPGCSLRAQWLRAKQKYDNCNVPQYWTDSCFACVPDGDSANFDNGTCTKNSGESMLCDNGWPTDGTNYSASYTALRFRIMQDALSEQNHTILYSLCEWGRLHFALWMRHCADYLVSYRCRPAMEMGKYDWEFVANDW